MKKIKRETLDSQTSSSRIKLHSIALRNRVKTKRTPKRRKLCKSTKTKRVRHHWVQCLSHLYDANKCRQCRQLSFAARGLELLLIIVSHITVIEKCWQQIVILQLFYRIVGWPFNAMRYSCPVDYLNRVKAFVPVVGCVSIAPFPSWQSFIRHLEFHCL